LLRIRRSRVRRFSRLLRVSAWHSFLSSPYRQFTHCFSSVSPFLFWYSRTTILSERPIPSGYVSAIGLVLGSGYTLFSDLEVLLRRESSEMATQQDMMTKKLTTGGSSRSSSKERRGSRRCKITQLMRIRPSDPNVEHFEDLRGSASVSRSGVYFQSSEPCYEVGMRLFVTMPFSQDPASMSREYLAEVVRRDVLPTSMFGIGIKILMEMGIQHSYNFGPGNPR
jgi:hypothetical protein